MPNRLEQALDLSKNVLDQASEKGFGPDGPKSSYKGERSEKGLKVYTKPTASKCMV